MRATYTTVQGDMWDNIAYTQLGSVSYTPALLALNTQYLNYYTFPAGIAITLPEPVITAPETLPPWRKVEG